ncbi:MAG: 2-amino-4-hydroxy-6-hydroxymethyldihydropteridine diphosphokinase [Candidatus Omnitrophica bacterium]|nr:2-amino-4-hydroxy-6-hydroxymethyldihydropteridine diphosphokinase [Candidatus Omnitrophota bacterium]
MAVCDLGLGTNLGNRKRLLDLALGEIRNLKGTKIIKISRVIESKPVGGPAGQGEFLNAALKIKTHLLPLSLLRHLKTIERKLGRPQRYPRYAPRVMDIDILFYADKKLSTKLLKIPHPKVFGRDFVMRPLLEIL